MASGVGWMLRQRDWTHKGGRDTDINQYTPDTRHLFETAPYSRVLSQLRDGAVNGVHLRDLERLTGLNDRELRRSIEYIRWHGVVILSGMQGYYLPVGLQEVRAYMRREERRAKSTFFTLKATRKLEKRLSGQGAERGETDPSG